MLIATALFQEVGNILCKQLVQLALTADHLTAHQVQGLDDPFVRQRVTDCGSLAFSVHQLALAQHAQVARDG